MTRYLHISLFIILPFFSGCTIIESGEVGVKLSFGTVSKEIVGQGLILQIPVARYVETWNIKLQEIQEEARVPSSEGLIVGLDTSMLFRVRAEDAPQIRMTIGRDYLSNLVIPYFRNSLRDIVSGYEVKQIYSDDGRREIADKILAYLRKNLDTRGIIVEDVLLRDVKLPEKFRESIESKLSAEQAAEKKVFERRQAEIDAQIEVVRAKGAAEAQKIVRSTLSEQYLKYLFIKNIAQKNDHVYYVPTENGLPLMKEINKK